MSAGHRIGSLYNEFVQGLLGSGFLGGYVGLVLIDPGSHGFHRGYFEHVTVSVTIV